MAQVQQTIDIPKAFEIALNHHHAGRLTEAEILYRQVLVLQPNNVTALNMLGLIAHQVGKSDIAVELISKAVSLDPSNAAAYNNLGEACQALGQMDRALACYQQALTLKPDYIEAGNNLGNLFNIHGRFDEALACYQKVLTLKPDYAEGYNNLGCLFNSQGKLHEALACFDKAVTLKPDYADAYANYAVVQVALGLYGEALETIRRAFCLQDTAKVRNLFAEAAPHTRLRQDNSDIRYMMARALSEPWARPADLSQSAISYIKMYQPTKECIDRAVASWPRRLTEQELFGPSGPAPLCQDPSLLRLLENTPAGDLEMEKFLTLARYCLLQAAIEDKTIPSIVLTFYCALARQCFINEYVFASTTEELALAATLRDKLSAALTAGEKIPVLRVVAVAAYFPLYHLPQADTLLHQYWPDAVSALLAQQVKEPLEERTARASMPRLTPIEDHVSLLVQQQYEENPYPRWTKALVSSETLPIGTYLRNTFPRAPFLPLGHSNTVDVLIAGCGTGQQPLSTATSFSNVQVTAIDLSLSSLCYAQRKTREMGVTNIAYAQADIMKLAGMGRTFDAIECAGVLHHLADPAAGLEILLSLLKPGGFLCLALYSEAAREHIVATRKFIAEKGYAADAEGIRRCRQELIGKMDTDPLLAKLLSFRDFFSTSECRDLIFHVQEHRFTLPQIKTLLEKSDLGFIGFIMDPVKKASYQKRFPDDGAMNNLDNWHRFETENPDTFYGMYQFWAQKSA